MRKLVRKFVHFEILSFCAEEFCCVCKTKVFVRTSRQDNQRGSGAVCTNIEAITIYNRSSRLNSWIIKRSNFEVDKVGLFEWSFS